MNIAGTSHWYDREQNIMEKQKKQHQRDRISIYVTNKYNLLCVSLFISYTMHNIVIHAV